MAIELMYIQPEQREETMQLYLTLTRDVVAAASSMAPALEEVSRLVAAGEYYKALQKMKRLLKYEKHLLSASRLPASRHGNGPKSGNRSDWPLHLLRFLKDGNGRRIALVCGNE